MTACWSFLTACAFVTLSGDEPKPSASAGLVKRLVHSFELTGRRALAVADPREPGVFVAAVLREAICFSSARNIPTPHS